MVIHMDGQEQDWIEAFGSCLPSRLRIQPFLGDEACGRSVLRQHVSARTARLKQAGLDEAEMRCAVERELLLLALYGYPRTMLQDTWSRCPQYPAAAKHARLVLQTWDGAFPGLARLQPDGSWGSRARAVWDM